MSACSRFSGSADDLPAGHTCLALTVFKINDTTTSTSRRPPLLAMPFPFTTFPTFHSRCRILFSSPLCRSSRLFGLPTAQPPSAAHGSALALGPLGGSSCHHVPTGLGLPLEPFYFSMASIIQLPVHCHLLHHLPQPWPVLG